MVAAVINCSVGQSVGTQYVSINGSSCGICATAVLVINCDARVAECRSNLNGNRIVAKDGYGWWCSIYDSVLAIINEYIFTTHVAMVRAIHA